jgi:helicase
MVGSVEPVLPDLVAHRLVEKRGTKLVMTPLARVMAEHFIGMERLLEIVRLTKVMDDPLEIIAELESEDVHKEKKVDPKKSGHKPKESGPSRHGHKRR